ncbi:SRPBCC family protein [Lentiprolixibacter aurantiacus]|uniref:SRPBCC family protein n=1 Tax=Lentiprolixibacter aurantiacus TaxID=2993939 RepID=A0AAE3MML5_9FLAO|nr:SRPBCC family protein [Lentiprolixibacter aurantiacus]MCX2720208.1 SRPBCC family protein [Lentiprolixibacter aurantiacus]
METFLYILLGLVVAIIFLATIAPKTYDVYRSIEISKPKAEVFEYLKYLDKQREWSPWEKRDPNMEHRFTGTDGTVGAISYWNGNKEVGEGEQEITKIEEGKRIETELRFIKPWKSQSDCYLEVNEVTKDNTKVTWGFNGQNKFPMSLMMLFMSMDKMIGKDFEEGLANLKTRLEG